MGKRDIRTVDYFSDNRRFSDLINARFFQGEQVVKPENLREADKELTYSKTQKGKKLERDNVMKWMGNTLLAIFVVEHQTEVDYHMVQRIMIAESMEYEKQWKERQKENKESGALKTNAEFISGMKKTDKFSPVITLVVYYGKEPYEGATRLHELLEWTKETERLKKYISDYHINVFDYHNQNSFEEYHTELKTLFEFMRYASEKEKLKKLLASKDKAYYNVDNETYEMIAELTNSKELLKHRQEHEMKEESDMCQAITEMLADERIEGRAEGRAEVIQALIETCRELGITKIITQEKLEQKFSMSSENAEEYMKKYW